jgi:hypothetical protein
MDRLPLLFTFKDRVYGDGFLADIEAHGRVLAVRGSEEEGGVWMNGVQPGGIAEGGEDDDKARVAFKKTYKAVLFDIASEAKNFNAFKQEVEKFFNEVCRPIEKEWLDAVKQVKKENYTEEGLRKKHVEKTAVKVTVKKVHLTHKDNSIDAECHQPPELDLAA